MGLVISRYVLYPTTALLADTDSIQDNHHYAEPQCGTPFYSQPSSPYDPNRIGIQGEFGGIGLRPADEK